MIRRIFFLIIFSSLVCMNVSYAQEDDALDSATEEENADSGNKNFGPIFDGLSISMSAGANFYYGDIASYNVLPGTNSFTRQVRGGFKASIARDILWGLGAQVNFQKGKLAGTRKTGAVSPSLSFNNDFFEASFQIRYLLDDILFKKNIYRRFKLYAHVGAGAMWYRTQLFETETRTTKDFFGYEAVEVFPGSTQMNLSDKVARAQTFTIPYGVSIVYQYSYKADIHLDISQSYTSTDRLDAFERSFSARDKFNYIGIGITYNFNRTPDDRPVKKKEENKEDEEDEDSDHIHEHEKKGLFHTHEKKVNKISKKDKKGDDELLNIRLKLFETQLKLFEMQYLIGN